MSASPNNGSIPGATGAAQVEGRRLRTPLRDIEELQVEADTEIDVRGNEELFVGANANTASKRRGSNLKRPSSQNEIAAQVDPAKGKRRRKTSTHTKNQSDVAMGQETNPSTKSNGSNGSSEGDAKDLLQVKIRHLHPGATRTLDVSALSGCRYKCSELVRVMEQALYSLGYPDVAKHLEMSSGVDLHSERVQKMQEGCLSGQWEEVITLIDQEKLHLFGAPHTATNGSGARPTGPNFHVVDDPALDGARDPEDIAERVQRAKFLVLEQKYLECLSTGNVQQALQCLREEITPLGINMERLHELAALMRCRTWQDLVKSKAWGAQHQAGPPGASSAQSGFPPSSAGIQEEPRQEGGSLVDTGSLGRHVGSGSQQITRQQLLTKLQEVIPSSVMLPENRLETLLGQAIANQVSHCMYYNKTDTTFSLLSDYACGPEQIPSITSQVLDGHSDEVWHVQFSNSGAMLASASADGTCIIWMKAAQAATSDGSDLNGNGAHLARGSALGAKKFQIKHELLGHKKPIAFVCWSPNDMYLLTCGNDHVLNVWDVEAGKVHHRYEKHMDSVTSCAWLPDSERFVSGSIDKHIYMWHLDGRCIRHWKGSRINDLAISRNGKWMVSTSNEKKFHLYDLVKDTEIAVQEQESIISLCLSKHSDMLLVNLQNQKIHLWDLNDFFASNGAISLPTEPVRRYRGQHEKQGRYVIRSCFGGSNETFVVSGSEDSQVYIWHQQKGDLLKVLSGHSGTVNAVTWNPADPYTFASASDDHSIRIWGRE